MRECKVVKVGPYMKQDGVKVSGYKYLKCMKPKAHSVKAKASPYSLLHSLHSMGGHYKKHAGNKMVAYKMAAHKKPLAHLKPRTHLKKPMHHAMGGHHKHAMGGHYKHAMGGHYKHAMGGHYKHAMGGHYKHAMGGHMLY